MMGNRRRSNWATGGLLATALIVVNGLGFLAYRSVMAERDAETDTKDSTIFATEPKVVDSDGTAPSPKKAVEVQRIPIREDTNQTASTIPNPEKITPIQTIQQELSDSATQEKTEDIVNSHIPLARKKNHRKKKINTKQRRVVPKTTEAAPLTVHPRNEAPVTREPDTTESEQENMELEQNPYKRNE